MKNKIFITGCAKTGTTLVRRLFNAFELTVYNKKEISLQEFIDSKFEVGKRTIDSAFSNWLKPGVLKKQFKIIKQNNIKIINVTRNKKDTLKSCNGWVTKKRYEACMRQASKFPEYITYSLDYSDLISSPDIIQVDLAKKLNLKILHKWSDFPDWFDSSEEIKEIQEEGQEYSIRRIGAKKK
jgi:hypothetical protein